LGAFEDKTDYYKVYHIRMIGNTNLEEGYVGITRRSLPYRLSQHRQSKRPVGDTLRSLPKDAVEIVEIARGDKAFALNLEYTLRPQRFIGWNTRAGGDRATVKCPACGKLLPKRKTGSYCEKCRPCKFPKGHTPHNYGKGQRYELISPEGMHYKPESFITFCKEQGLTHQNLCKVAEGIRHHHKGWIAIKLN
jgi:hypothetical protein